LRRRKVDANRVAIPGSQFKPELNAAGGQMTPCQYRIWPCASGAEMVKKLEKKSI